jgi:lysozyme family protein
MTKRFEDFIPFILSHETVFKKGHYGNYANAIAENDPNDPGGVTKFGIDFGEHKGRPWNLTADQIRNLTVDGATHLYWLHWVKDSIETMAPKVGECFFNVATMSGVEQAKLCLSRASTPEMYLQDYLGVLDKIVRRRPASAQYIKGWKTRIHDLAKTLAIALSNP